MLAVGEETGRSEGDRTMKPGDKVMVPRTGGGYSLGGDLRGLCGSGPSNIPDWDDLPREAPAVSGDGV